MMTVEQKMALFAARKVRATTHGMCATSEYMIWVAMRQRCANPNNKAYPNYGGRGIQVCERWMRFENFLADMGPRPPGLSIERIANDLGYCKSNCKWGTRREQNNNSRNNHHLTFNGRTQSIHAWSREVSLNVRTIHSRLRLGWPLEMVLTRQPCRGLHLKHLIIMTPDEHLAVLAKQIEYHRQAAARLRRRAEAEDRIADGLVKECAAIGTGTLPLLKGTND
jgi:hypothetical protein